eukprot:4059185-Pyramimonas_sp.AAC.1
MGDGGLDLVHRVVEVLGLHFGGGNALLEGGDIVLDVVLAFGELGRDVSDVCDETGLIRGGNFLCGGLELFSHISNLNGQVFLDLSAE